jgi:hypothetical protein
MLAILSPITASFVPAILRPDEAVLKVLNNDIVVSLGVD